MNGLVNETLGGSERQAQGDWLMDADRNNVVIWVDSIICDVKETLSQLRIEIESQNEGKYKEGR